MAKELDMAKYIKMFISEARDNLRVMNDSMLELEKDPSNRELVDQIFRSCHTIKGMANMMNMKAVADLAHALEGLLACVRDGKLEPTGTAAETIFDGFDALDVMVLAVESSQQLQENQPIVDQLREIIAGAPKKAEPKKPRAPAVKKPSPKADTTVYVKLGRKCALPSARAVVIIKELSKAANIMQTTPSDDEIEGEQVFDMISVVLEPKAKFQEALKRIAAMTDVDEVGYGPTSEPREKWHKVSTQETQPTGVAEIPLTQTVRVGMDKLDDLLDNVGELVIGRSRLLEKASVHDDYELQEISTLIDKLTSDIQSKVLGIRMIPLEMVMSRFPRMVRDISKAQNKEVELVVEGGSIELDRTVVDRITDPMMHLLRNCIDHGLENAEEREKAGKRPKGLIRIVASKQQDHVLIEVSDDGRGIDLDAIRDAAVARNVMTRELADNTLARDLIDLLFRPGFSTKTEVSQVSGRGVGLDVVKKAVEDLGGTVMVNTTKGHGTTFSLWLPFTLAIIEAMLVSIADQTYAVPMSTIVESHRFELDEIKTIRSREVVQLRGEVLPLIKMRDFFGLAKRPSSGSLNALIVQSRERRAAVEVDDLLGHQQIVVKSLDQRLRKVKGISGGTILGSGKIALILDVDSILGA